MDTPGIPTGSGTPSPPARRREVQLQGPRPAPLRVSKDSHKIRKPPPVPRNHQQPQSQSLTIPAANDDRQPVIIYDVSPKVYHADASNFMSVVQQLTGNYPSASSSYDPFVGGGGTGSVPPVSPAARLASIERTSPTERNRERERSAVNSEFVGMVEAGVDVSQIPGILSPAPSNLPGIAPGMFSPSVSDSQNLWGIYDYLMSPPVFGNSFVPSPYALFSSVSPGVSPTISPVDLFNFGDF